MKIVGKSFLRIRIFHADSLKRRYGAVEWAEIFARFHGMVSEIIQEHGGNVIKLFSDGFLCAFEHAQQAIHGAIAVQETLQAHPLEIRLSSAMGLASGQAQAIQLSDSHQDYFGPCVDMAEELAQKARGNAILMNHPIFPPSDGISVKSKAGILANRENREYFVEQPTLGVSGLGLGPYCYSIFWQEEPAQYLSHSPIEEPRSAAIADAPADKIYFGRVSAFKKERGFGFIQYYTEGEIYKEIYFHMTYVVDQVPIAEHDHVQFVVRPGKEERPQACSVLVMGSRHRGQIESIQEDGSGFITLPNHESKLIRFFMLPRENISGMFAINDMVDFTTASGSDMEGLVALDVTPHQVSDQDHPEDPEDHLTLGSLQRAVVHVYFSDKGYGFAKCGRSNIYIHVSELADLENEPNSGDWIEFTISPGRDNTFRANNIRVLAKKELLV